MRAIRARSMGALVLAAIAVCWPAGAGAQLDYVYMSGAGTDIRKTVIAPGIYQFMTMRDSYVRELNSTAIVNDNDILVFDTNTRPSSARLILAEIRKITGKPVRYVVNSHHHPDHWSGNEVYADAFPGLDIIATEKCLQQMQAIAPLWPGRFAGVVKRREAALAQETATGKRDDGTVLTPEDLKQDQSDLVDYKSFAEEARTLRRVFPNVTYTDRLTMQHGGREFRFISVTGDAEGTTVLYLPKEKVLLTGDAVSYPMPYVSDHPRQELADLRMLSQLDVNTIIPGHGPAFHDKAFLALEIKFLEAVLNGVDKARSQGAKTLEDFQKAVTAGELREQFAHGDSDIAARFKARVSDLVGFIVAEDAAAKSK